MKREFDEQGVALSAIAMLRTGRSTLSAFHTGIQAIPGVTELGDPKGDLAEAYRRLCAAISSWSEGAAELVNEHREP